MKHSKNTTANALALTGAILWVICSLVTLLAPDVYLYFARLWMHTMEIVIQPFSFFNFVVGGITFTIAAWLVGYLYGWCHEVVSRK